MLLQVVHLVSQDISIAGNRAGLAGERSGLFMEQIRIVKEARSKYGKPRYMVWENVSSVFSLNDGEDFRVVLEEIAKISDSSATIPRLEGKQKWSKCGTILDESYSISWRIHDAQWWGVPQRRKRICILADFDGDTAPKLLFESELWRTTDDGTPIEAVGDFGYESRSQVQSIAEGLSGNIEQGGETRQGATTSVKRGIGKTSGALSFLERSGKPGGGKGILISNEKVGTLSTLNNQNVMMGIDLYNQTITGDKLMSIRAKSDNEHIPSIMCVQKRFSNVNVIDNEISPTLEASAGMGGNNIPIVLNDQGGSVMNVTENQTGTLRAQEHGHQPIVYGIGSYDSNAMKSSNPESGIYVADTVRTLDLNGGSPACNQGGMAVVFNGSSVTSPVNASNPKAGDPCHTLTDDDRNYVICIEGNGTRESHRGDGYKESETMYTLNTVEQHAIAYDSEIVGALCARDYKGAGNQYVDDGKLIIQQNETSDQEILNNTVIEFTPMVRKLTPQECAKLQGFPSDWLDIGEWVDSKGKKHKDADSPKYKAAGNSLALPYWQWLAERICSQYDEPVRLGSLFSGIGGFELVFSRCGAIPVWSSEVEEYCIAVAKKHFGED